MIDVRSLRCAAAVGCLSAALASLASAESPRVPTIDDLLAVKTVGGTQISPDGRFVAYTVNETDLENDAFVTHLWIVPAGGGTPFQLTRGAKSVGGGPMVARRPVARLHEPARRRSESDLRDSSRRG